MNKLTQMNLGALEKYATSFRADFRFGPLNIMVMVFLCLGGLVAHLVVYPFELQAVITMIVVALCMAVVFRVAQISGLLISGKIVWAYIRFRLGRA